MAGAAAADTNTAGDRLVLWVSACCCAGAGLISTWYFNAGYMVLLASVVGLRSAECCENAGLAVLVRGL